MEIKEIVIKLTASRELLEAKLNRSSGLVYIDETTVVFNRYTEFRQILQSAYPEFFLDLPKHSIPPVDEHIGDRALTYRSNVFKLVEDINYCLSILSAITEPTSLPATVTREGMFFSGQFFDALLKITDLIKVTQKSIIIVDGYINENVLNLLTAKGLGVTASLLTKKVEPAIVVAAGAFNKQYGGLSIRTAQAFHDRFVIIDDRDFYHFGASLKDLGNRGFMFSRIEESFVINALRTEFNKEWDGSTVVV